MEFGGNDIHCHVLSYLVSRKKNHSSSTLEHEGHLQWGAWNHQKTMFSNQHPVAYYRAILEVNGCGDVKDCSAHLVSVKCDGEEIEIGEVLQLTFASHRGLKDLKPGIPAFLDLLAVSKANKLYIAVEDLKLPNSISHEQIFPRQGRYLLEIRVSGPPATALIFEFIWDGEWDHSKVRLISQNVIKPLRLNLDKAI